MLSEQFDEAGFDIAVYCDTQKPELPDGIQFDFVGARLRARIKPSEPLLSVRIRPKGSLDWVLLMKDDSEVYTYSTELPERATIFEVEMTDLVGNEAVARDQCNLFVPRGEIDGEDDFAGGVNP